MPLTYLGSSLPGLPQARGNTYTQSGGKQVPYSRQYGGGLIAPKDAKPSGLAYQESMQESGEDPADVGTEDAIYDEGDDMVAEVSPQANADPTEIKDVQNLAQTGAGIRQILRDNKKKMKVIKESRRGAKDMTRTASPSLVKALEIASRQHVVQKGGALPTEPEAKKEAVKLIDPKVPLEDKIDVVQNAEQTGGGFLDFLGDAVSTIFPIAAPIVSAIKNI